MKNLFLKHRDELADGIGIVSFFLIFLPMYYFEINFVINFFIAFGICLAISYLIKENEVEDLNQAVENFEEK
ncbi:MAG: hypothetical protein ABGX41_09335 [Pseudohongiella sp.]|jgi:hypothetical protein|nr:hypothetical protein [Gammaproteobacteria bacterium]